MIGDTHIIEGVEFEVVWSGGEGLVPDRSSKVTELWVPPPRIYNKKSAYWTTPRALAGTRLDKPAEQAETENLPKNQPESEHEHEREAVVLYYGDSNEDV